MEEGRGQELPLSGIKRKYVALLENATEILVELQELKRQRRDWQQERAFLVDRNVDLEVKVQKLEGEKSDRLTRRAAKKEKRSRSQKERERPKSVKQEDAEKSIDVEALTAKEAKEPEPKKKRKPIPAMEPLPTSIVLNPKLCVHVMNERQCRLFPLPGFTYCHHHAAFDPATGYIWCAHVDTSGKPCQIAVVKSEYPFCKYHTKYHEPPPGYVPPIDKSKPELDDRADGAPGESSKSWRAPWKPTVPKFVADEESSDEGEAEKIVPFVLADDGDADGEMDEEDDEEGDGDAEGEGEEMDLGVAEPPQIDLGLGAGSQEHLHHDEDVKDDMMVTLHPMDHQEPAAHDTFLNPMENSGWDMAHDGSDWNMWPGTH